MLFWATNSFPSSVLRHLVSELLPRRRKFSQLVSHHILCHYEFMVYLAVVHLELESDKCWQDCCGACLSFDRWWRRITGFGADDWKT